MKYWNKGSQIWENFEKQINEFDKNEKKKGIGKKTQNSSWKKSGKTVKKMVERSKRFLNVEKKKRWTE